MIPRTLGMLPETPCKQCGNMVQYLEHLYPGQNRGIVRADCHGENTVLTLDYPMTVFELKVKLGQFLERSGNMRHSLKGRVRP